VKLLFIAGGFTPPGGIESFDVPARLEAVVADLIVATKEAPARLWAACALSIIASNPWALPAASL
jgi:hypothetical protein